MLALGLDVLVDPEGVVRVVGRLHRGQPVVVVAVAGPDALPALVHHHVHVRAARRVRVQRLEVVDAPLAQRADVRRVGIDAGVDRGPARVAVAPGRVGAADVVRRAVDRVQVHGRLPARQRGAEARVLLDRGVGDLVDEVRAPVPLVAGRVEAVERALEVGVRHRRRAVQQGLRQGVEERRHRCRGFVCAADVAPHHAAHRAQVQFLRERRRRRHAAKEEEAVELARRAREEVTVGRQDLAGLPDIPERRARRSRSRPRAGGTGTR